MIVSSCRINVERIESKDSTSDVFRFSTVSSAFLNEDDDDDDDDDDDNNSDSVDVCDEPSRVFHGW